MYLAASDFWLRKSPGSGGPSTRSLKLGVLHMTLFNEACTQYAIRRILTKDAWPSVVSWTPEICEHSRSPAGSMPFMMQVLHAPICTRLWYFLGF